MASTVPSSVAIAPPAVDRFAMPPRLLLGPGPCNAHPAVYAAMSTPQVGHLDPSFLKMMDNIMEMMRYVWQTENKFTIPVSGTGSAAMEAAICNVTLPGDKFLVFSNGYFGTRAADMASRYGAKVETISRPWGTAFTLEEITAGINEHKPQLVFIVHAETSTGVLQPLQGIGEVCRQHDALLIVDTVTSISGVPLLLDEWKVDVAYAGTQKCLACPPGGSPLTFNDRAMKVVSSRQGDKRVPNWYLDMTMIQKYLVVDGGAPRSYHHTAPISQLYAVREALALVVEETLPVRWARHQATAEALWDGAEAMGLKLLVPRELRCPSLTTICIPDGVDGKAVCAFLRNNFNIEIGGGLGELAGQVWRIGMMGWNAEKQNVNTVLTALKAALADQGWTGAAKADDATAAATETTETAAAGAGAGAAAGAVTGNRPSTHVAHAPGGQSQIVFG